MKTLIIAEKPSVARDIAEALGVGSRLENDTLVISNCIGHLVRLSHTIEPGAALPVIPNAFTLSVIDSTKEQFNKLKKLMSRSDISTIINACDAGREGELIFRLVYDKINCSKPIERMWLQSMTPESIRSAFRDRKPGEQYQSLYDAAKSRSEADWLYGMNGSRAVKSAVGRVMTPTLAMVVERYEANKNFKPTTFYEVMADFKLMAGDYSSKLLNGKEFAKYESKDEAEAIVNQLSGFAFGKVEDHKEVKKKNPYPLFHLTSLQQEANRKFGYSAAKTLSITQALYEKHKAVTYPRTDANVLPSDYIETAEQVIEILAANYPSSSAVINNDWVQIQSGNKRIFNDALITDHFAIVPTNKIPSDLSIEEKNIYDLIVKRFIAVFYPAAEYNHTTRITYVDEFQFKTTGNVLIKAGWLAVYGNQADDENGDKEETLVMAAPDETANLTKVHTKDGQTKPPALYNEATLLKAMETAGKELEDDEYANILKGKGIGTPATRAGIIEKLKETGKFEAYMKIDKKSLIPTERGIKIIHYLRDNAPSLISPELTGEWEYKLTHIESEELARTTFMAQIHNAVTELVNSLPTSTAQQYRRKEIGKCPSCEENDLVDRKYSYMCECGFKINKEVAGYKLTDKDLSDIISSGKTTKIKSFKSKAGKPFAATLVLDKDNNTLSFQF